MNAILDFLKKLSDIITWPVAILLIAIVFRRQLLLVLKAMTGRIETAGEVSVTKDGITIKQLEQKINNVDKKADVAQQTADAVATNSIGGKTVAEISAIQEKNTAAPKLFPQQASTPTNEDDPQKGRWGGSPASNGRELRATVTPLANGSLPLYRIQLEVVATNAFPVTGKVRFHLHPTFPNPTPEVDVQNGKAMLTLLSYGSFTVGAEILNETTRLELDLANLPGVSDHFKET